MALCYPGALVTTREMTTVSEISRLRVDVSELLRRPGASKRLEFEDIAPELALDMGRVAGDGMVLLRLAAESLIEGILLSGTLAGSWTLSCRRCLVAFEEPFSIQVRDVFTYPGQPELEEGYRVDGNELDLSPLVRDAIALALPLNPLHAPDCRGLCPACGQDRNVVDCGHASDHIDLRWEPLGRLREQMGE